MRTLLFFAALPLAIAGCTESHIGDVDGGALAPDAYVLDAAVPVDAGGTTDTLVAPDAGRDAPAPPRDVGPVDVGSAPVQCNGVTCAAGQICCELDLRCIEPSDPACVLPPGSGPETCASNLDCPSGSTCQGLIVGQCGGTGMCAITPDGCSGWHGICGCDGQTYPDPCAAAVFGIRVAAYVPCGSEANPTTYVCSVDGLCRHGHCDAGRCVNDDPLIVCGTDGNCPSGQTCCTRNRRCLAPSDAALCNLPPPGTVAGCETDTQCQRFDGSYWFGSRTLFCDADSCSGAGGCASSEITCSGTLDPVCGCDGMTYQNRCEARRASMRITHTGACP